MAQQRFRVQLHMKDLGALKGLDVDNACMPIRQREDGSIEMTAVVSGDVLKKLQRKRTFSVEVLGDRAAEAAAAARQVSRTNRYADGSLPTPRGRSR
jgi:hypothetical protein